MEDWQAPISHLRSPIFQKPVLPTFWLIFPIERSAFLVCQFSLSTKKGCLLSTIASQSPLIMSFCAGWPATSSSP